jgi:GNAT superfamily N-acetyltransferase
MSESSPATGRVATVRIRQATVADAEQLARLRWADSTEDGTVPAQSAAAFCAAFAGFVRRALAAGAWTVWVAEADGRLLAHVYVQAVEKVPRPDRPAARWGYATAVYTVPEARNQGIGSRLLRRVIAWAAADGLELLLLWPSERSVPFYERAGFGRSPDALERDLRA